MDRFLREYNGKYIEDWYSVTSDDFKSFARKFKNYLKRILPEFNVVGFTTGHYDVSGFLEKDGNYIYFSYDVPRGRQLPIDIYNEGCMFGVLIRTASSDKDYRGGNNNFCSLAAMQDVTRKLYNISYMRKRGIA